MIDLALLISTITLSTPLLLAAMGGYTSERSGIVNIGLEGMMISGACMTGMIGLATGSALWGLVGGILAAIVMSLLHWTMTQIYRVDHIISGMAINVTAFGLTNYLNSTFSDPRSSAAAPTYSPWLFNGLALSIPIGLFFYSKYAKGGLRLRAVGSDPDKARQMGVSPIRIRLLALIATGVFCGLSGAAILTNASRYVDEMTSGRGYIALAALILGRWKPIPAALACVGFGFAYALQLKLQGTELAGARIPSQVWQALPYVVTLIAIAGFLGKSKAPAGLGKP